MADPEKTATPTVDSSVLDNKESVASIKPSAVGSVNDTESKAFDEKSTIERNPAASLSDLEDDDDNFEYPTKWKLTIITIALCLSVFCMALVRQSVLNPVSNSALMLIAG